MRFGNPEILWLLLTVPVLWIFFWWNFRRRRKKLARFAHGQMLQRMTSGISRGRQWAKSILLLGALVFAIIALARPQFGAKMEMIKRKGLDVVIALDVSLSMHARDIQPSRLERAKHELRKFVNRLSGDRVGLVVFAGDAFLQCPLTLDYGALKMFLDITVPEMVATPGTALGPAIQTSLKAFDPGQKKYRVIVLLTDGEDHSGKAMEAAKTAAQEGVMVYTVGIGQPSGVPIPLEKQGGGIEYKKDEKGNVVTTRLDDDLLQQIASVTEAQFFHAVPGSFELGRVLDEIENMEKREMESRHYIQYEERFQYPLAVAVILLALELLISERRRKRKEWRGRFVS